MIHDPAYCQPQHNLGTVTERMWNANCGILPVVSIEGKTVGVVTDRDFCIALDTRNRLPGDILVAEVMTGKLHSCSPDDHIHTALRTMRKEHVRRLPVISKDSTLVGIVSLDDLAVHAAEIVGGTRPELTYKDVVKTYEGFAAQRAIDVAHPWLGAVEVKNEMKKVEGLLTH
jgi:signal-transduction protein with cAMP-binding, CBS, and nucleotidyltransferase domain